ncbi:hypothetical protein M8J75_005780 [Diaphorina citri]|nr:hypothetical protein M8J75_005780 [Diaphorina citri]KAI5726095.1 hypothetical protein M8J77_023752 [Diaphorina citri]
MNIYFLITSKQPIKLCSHLCLKLLISQDGLRKEYPTIVNLSHNHNHRINVADAMIHRPVRDDIKEKFVQLFRNHHPPSRALHIHKQDLMEEYNEEYYKVAADSAICPPLSAVYRLFHKEFKKDYGEEQNSIHEYLQKIANKVEKNTKIKSKVMDNGDVVVAALPPLMERCHSLKTSGNTVFIDSGGNMDWYNCRVFLLLCDSNVGGLPLGFFLSTSETEECISTGLELLKSILPASCFGDSTSKCSVQFMTDDCQAEINALRKIFPASDVLLCTFHILQAVWRWLLQGEHGIDQLDRQHLYSLFKKTVFAGTSDDFEFSCKKLLEDSVVNKYNNFVCYIKKYISRSSMWAHSFRTTVRGNNTNNIVEGAMRVMKDCILSRTKAYNPIQLFKFLEMEFCQFYTMKIEDMLNGKYWSKRSKYFPEENKLEDLEIKKAESLHITVVHKKSLQEYNLDLEAGLCSCFKGKQGAPCSHQHKASVFLKRSGPNTIPLDSQSKLFLHWLAHGKTGDDNFYLSLDMYINENQSNMSMSTLSPAWSLPVPVTSPIDIVLNTEPETSEQTPNLDWDSLQLRWMNLVSKKKDNNNEAEFRAVEKATTMDSESNVIEALINMVQYHPLLWNPQHRDYKDKQKCLMKWNFIGTQLNLDAQTALSAPPSPDYEPVPKMRSTYSSVSSSPIPSLSQAQTALSASPSPDYEPVPKMRSTYSSVSIPSLSQAQTALSAPPSPDYEPVPKMRSTYSSVSIPSLSQAQTALSAPPSPDYEPAPKMRSTYSSVSSSPIPSLSQAQTALSPDSFISPCSSPIDPPPSCPPTSKPGKASQQFLKYIRAREEAAAAAAASSIPIHENTRWTSSKTRGGQVP